MCGCFHPLVLDSKEFLLGFYRVLWWIRLRFIWYRNGSFISFFLLVCFFFCGPSVAIETRRVLFLSIALYFSSFLFSSFTFIFIFDLPSFLSTAVLGYRDFPPDSAVAIRSAIKTTFARFSNQSEPTISPSLVFRAVARALFFPLFLWFCWFFFRYKMAAVESGKTRSGLTGWPIDSISDRSIGFFFHFFCCWCWCWCWCCCCCCFCRVPIPALQFPLAAAQPPPAAALKAQQQHLQTVDSVRSWLQQTQSPPAIKVGSPWPFFCSPFFFYFAFLVFFCVSRFDSSADR